MTTNLRLSCAFDWTGAQLSDFASVPIEAAEKTKYVFNKYICACAFHYMNLDGDRYYIAVSFTLTLQYDGDRYSDYEYIEEHFPSPFFSLS